MVKKRLILLSGYPATGKSYLANMILERHPEFEIIIPDTIKEALWDQYGFKNSAEKEYLEKEIWNQYYLLMEQKMNVEVSVITDYPFSEKQKPQLVFLTEQFQYKVLTVRMVGDIEVLYQRSRKRDLEQSRHLGHSVNSYQKGDYLADRSKADNFLEFDLFKERCLKKGYDKFRIGELIEIDATYFEKVPYNDVLRKIDLFSME